MFGMPCARLEGINILQALWCAIRGGLAMPEIMVAPELEIPTVVTILMMMFAAFASIFYLIRAVIELRRAHR